MFFPIHRLSSHGFKRLLSTMGNGSKSNFDAIILMETRYLQKHVGGPGLLKSLHTLSSVSIRFTANKIKKRIFFHCRLLLDSPMESDIDDDLKTATTSLVERETLPTEYLDRLLKPIGLTAFDFGSNTLLASSAFAHYLLHRRSKNSFERLLRAIGLMIVASRVVIDHAVNVIRLH
uniref:Hormonesensitive lipase putative n=1 Tax=Albugo laibachii Nc14 TaxID=890382 RepID=F0WYS6_9STRA|nr:hormonesensitive lipase putative [Albugo laibachii Nc14]|eukprot:CCA26635.1 hormonesensitive lipase putative [Albugo laibachii Nc14]